MPGSRQGDHGHATVGNPWGLKEPGAVQSVRRPQGIDHLATSPICRISQVLNDCMAGVGRFDRSDVSQ